MFRKQLNKHLQLSPVLADRLFYYRSRTFLIRILRLQVASVIVFCSQESLSLTENVFLRLGAKQRVFDKFNFAGIFVEQASYGYSGYQSAYVARVKHSLFPATSQCFQIMHNMHSCFSTLHYPLYATAHIFSPVAKYVLIISRQSKQHVQADSKFLHVTTSASWALFKLHPAYYYKRCIFR